MSERLQPTLPVREQIPARRLPQPPEKPQLIRPSIKYGQHVENHDVFRFPKVDDVRARHAEGENGTVLKLLAFEKAVREAEVCILVLDPHFSVCDAEVLKDAVSISRASDIRLLTGRDASKREGRERRRRDMTQSLNMNRSDSRQVEVQWRTTLDTGKFPFLHDRFAIIDRAVWHFGSTVGRGHKGLTAASGPWSASETRAMEFFETCWRLCNA